MVKTVGRPILATSAAAALMAPLPTQAEDSSVKRRLDSAGQRYKVDKDGDFKITLGFKDDQRTHVVFVSGTPDTVDNLIVLNIFAAAAKVDAGRVGATALDILRANNKFKTGNFEVQGNILLFTIKLSDASDGNQIQRAAQLAAIAADEEE